MEEYKHPDYHFCWADDDTYMQNKRALKRKLRQNLTSQTDYIARELREHELAGFHAASAILWRPAREGSHSVQLLMAFERRKNQFLFNFIGGHRDRFEEESFDVMTREVEEETAGYLKLCPHTPTDAIMWDTASKQAVFVRELSPSEFETSDGDIEAAVQGLGRPPEDTEGATFSPPECVLTMAWIDLVDFCNDKWRARNVHPQTVTMAKTLMSKESRQLLAETAPSLADALVWQCASVPRLQRSGCDLPPDTHNGAQPAEHITEARAPKLNFPH